jgi:tetratricopeptide (TPR) repeat protein
MLATATLHRIASRRAAFERHFQSAVLAADRGDEPSAAKHFALAAKADPIAWGQLGTEAMSQKRYQDALRIMTQVLALTDHPRTQAACHCNIGSIFTLLGERDLALASFRRGVDLWPDNHELLCNYALSLKWAGDLRGAFKWIHRAIQVRPSGEAIFNRSIMHLLAGNFTEGFRDYEARFDNPKSKLRMPDVPRPLWTGQPLAGKTLLIWGEQGTGDVIQMLRYAPLLKAMGCTLLGGFTKALHRLAETMGCFDKLYETNDPLENFDFHCPVMSLPLRFGTTVETIPPAPYITGQSAGVPHLCGPHYKIGICWAGSTDHAQDLYRSTNLEAWPLEQWKAMGHEIVSFQFGHRSMDALDNPNLTQPDRAPEFRLQAVPAKDYLDTVHALAEIDLVISVDTSLVHLCGAIGKPCWALIPHAPDWRWMLNRTDSPWYPSLRLFRQPQLHDWASVFAAITAELRAYGEQSHVSCLQRMQV